MDARGKQCLLGWFVEVTISLKAWPKCVHMKCETYEKRRMEA